MFVFDSLVPYTGVVTIHNPIDPYTFLAQNYIRLKPKHFKTRPELYKSKISRPFTAPTYTSSLCWVRKDTGSTIESPFTIAFLTGTLLSKQSGSNSHCMASYMYLGTYHVNHIKQWAGGGTDGIKVEASISE